MRYNPDRKGQPAMVDTFFGAQAASRIDHHCTLLSFTMSEGCLDDHGTLPSLQTSTAGSLRLIGPMHELLQTHGLNLFVCSSVFWLHLPFLFSCVHRIVTANEPDQPTTLASCCGFPLQWGDRRILAMQGGAGHWFGVQTSGNHQKFRSIE